MYGGGGAPWSAILHVVVSGGLLAHGLSAAASPPVQPLLRCKAVFLACFNLLGEVLA